MSNEENVEEPSEDDADHGPLDKLGGAPRKPLKDWRRRQPRLEQIERVRRSTAQVQAALKNYSAMANITAKPSWLKLVNQMKFINSDAWLSGAGQSNLTWLSSILSKNADFRFNSDIAKAASHFAKEQTSWLKTIEPVLELVRTSFYPSNLRGIEDLEFEEVEKVVMLDGIALHGVPRREIAEQFIRADGSAARREILGRRWKAISADCRAAVESCDSTSPAVAPYLPFAAAALDALDADNPKAAQAMATLVLDTVVNGYFGQQRYALTPNNTTTTNAAYQEFTLRKFIAIAPLWQAYQRYKTSEGDPIPTTFSRHATVHGVSAKQFTRRNAVQAVLFVSSLLLFFDEAALAQKVA